MSMPSDTRFSRTLRRCHNIDDLRQAAKKALPFPIFDHVDGGSDDETTLTANNNAFNQYCLQPRYCSGVESVDASTTVLGQRIEWPFFTGPAGGLKFLHRHGEIGVAKASHKYGTAFAMSGWTNTRPEDISRRQRRAALLPAAALPLARSDGRHDPAGQRCGLRRANCDRG